MDDTTTTRDSVAAVLLLRADGAALLQHRDDKPGLRHANMWVPPGGHCDFREDVLTCAYREMEEETAYRCSNLRWLTCLEDDPGHGWKSYDLNVFCEVYDGLQPVECREGQSIAFVPRERMGELNAPEFLGRVWDQALAVLFPNEERFVA